MDTEKIIRKVIDYLEKAKGNYQPENIFWISGQRNEDNLPCGDYCKECAMKIIKEHPKYDWHIDGGWGGDETDMPAYCERCGKQLAYYLLDSGCVEECEHFLSNDIIIEIKKPEHAYELLQIINRQRPNFETNCVGLKIYDNIKKTNCFSQYIMANKI